MIFFFSILLPCSPAALASLFAAMFLSPCFHSLIFVSLSASLVWPDFQGGFPPVGRGYTHHFCTLVCRLVSRQRQICSHANGSATCSSTHFCPGALRLRCTTCQPAVSLGKWKGGGREECLVTMAQMKLVIFLSTSFHFSFSFL